jgi:hypothetical protein
MDLEFDVTPEERSLAILIIKTPSWQLARRVSFRINMTELGETPRAISFRVLPITRQRATPGRGGDDMSDSRSYKIIVGFDDGVMGECGGIDYEGGFGLCPNGSRSKPKDTPSQNE